MSLPTNLKYTDHDEWVRVEGDVIVLGITDYAQDALGDIVFFDAPAVGTEVERNSPFSEVESTKSVSEIFAPVGGRIVEVNSRLVDEPELMNGDPYGEGWICVLQPGDPDDYDQLMDAAGYRELTAD
jgi:glycine cleavage system H protein